jgi:selenocysteine lyase/cysteine desulfurase
VLQRGRSTLVSWRAGDGTAAQALVERLAGEGIVVRSIPLGGLVRVSVGAWSSEEELERLVGLVCA